MNGFDFTIGKTQSPYVAWLSSGLSFNGRCLELLRYPRRVYVGIDRAGKRMAIKAADEESGEGVYNFAAVGEKKNRATISSVTLRGELRRLLNRRPPAGGIRFSAVFDEAENLLIVDLNGIYKSH